MMSQLAGGRNEQSLSLGFEMPLCRTLLNAHVVTLDARQRPAGGMDAVVCLGNSFAHLPDFSGDNGTHITAIRNFYDELRPGMHVMVPNAGRRVPGHVHQHNNAVDERAWHYRVVSCAAAEEERH
jgi:hypothetical protein